jgi:hypothetical protein
LAFPAAVFGSDVPFECVAPFPSCRACAAWLLGPLAGSQASRKLICASRVPSGTPSAHALAWAECPAALSKRIKIKESFRMVFMGGIASDLRPFEQEYIKLW